MYLERLQTALPAIRERIAEAATRSGRSGDDVTLVAVTKTHPVEAIDAALQVGLRDLGENRVAELLQKTAARPDADIRWHMIGHLQSRKAPQLIGHAHLIHSVDSVKLAARLSRKLEETGGTERILVQVNTSGEGAKSGFDRPSAEDAILEIAALPGLRVDGLMTMAPFVDEEAVLRPCFARLREISEAVRAAGTVGPALSMGMTNDLDLAIEEGSTMVRIGTALFGARPTPAATHA